MSDDPKTVQNQPDPVTTGAPVLPLRDVVVYPHMVIPLFVGREKSIQALDHAMQIGKQIVLVAQKQADVDEPGVDDVNRVGTLATILQLLKLPDGTVKVLVEGGQRVRLSNLSVGDYFSADVEILEDDGEQPNGRRGGGSDEVKRGATRWILDTVVSKWTRRKARS